MKEKHLVNHKQITMEHCEITAKEYDKQYSNFKNVMTVKDLKELLNKVEDDSIPVIIESFSDPFTADDEPLFDVSESESFSNESNELSRGVILGCC